MTLKHFHVLLILTAAVTGAGLAFWAWLRFQASGAGMDGATAAGSLLLSFVLLGYLVWFIRKTNRKGWD